MRGHCESDYPQDHASYSEELTVGDMRAILDACGVERAVIGGLSLGGYMTLAFHLRHPGMCRALMLFDTGPGRSEEHTSELQSLMRISYAVFCLKQKNKTQRLTKQTLNYTHDSEICN